MSIELMRRQKMEGNLVLTGLIDVNRMWCALCVHSLFQLFAAIWLTLALSWWLQFNSFRIIQAEEKLLWFVRDLLTSRIRIWPMKRFATNAHGLHQWVRSTLGFPTFFGAKWVRSTLGLPPFLAPRWNKSGWNSGDEMNRDEMNRDEMAAMKCPRIAT